MTDVGTEHEDIPVNPPLPPESGGPHPDDHPEHPDKVVPAEDAPHDADYGGEG